MGQWTVGRKSVREKTSRIRSCWKRYQSEGYNMTKWWNDDGDNVMGAHDTIQRKLDNTSNPSLRSGCEQISNYGKRIHLTNFEGYESNNPFVRQIIRAHCHTILVNRTEQWWCSVGFCSWTVQGLFSCASVGRMETTVNQVDSVLDDLPKSWCN